MSLEINHRGPEKAHKDLSFVLKRLNLWAMGVLDTEDAKDAKRNLVLTTWKPDHHTERSAGFAISVGSCMSWSKASTV